MQDGGCRLLEVGVCTYYHDSLQHSASCQLKARRPDGSVYHSSRKLRITDSHCPRPRPRPPPPPPRPALKTCPAAPGLVCMEKANYPRDPGFYDKRINGVRSRGRCRMICNRDPHCCHWVHYGPNRGNTLSITSHQHFSIVDRIHGPNICWLKKKKTSSVIRNPREINNGPVYAGSLNCN